MNQSNHNGHRTPQSVWEARWNLIKSSPRVIILGTLILLIFGAYGRRLWELQITEGEEYSSLAQRQSTREVSVSALRGLIYDRNGEPLVRNVPSFKVVVVPEYLPYYDFTLLPAGEDGERRIEVTLSEETENVLIRLAVLLDLPYTTTGDAGGPEEDPQLGVREKVEQAIQQGAFYTPVVIQRNVERDRAMLVAQERLTLPGVSVEVDSVREYPYGSLVSQVLGYLAPVPGELEAEYKERGYDPSSDRVGVQGVEAAFEEQLRGQKGRRLVEEDVMGRVVRIVSEESAPVPGGNVYLTLDLELQRHVEEALRWGMNRPTVNSPRGVAIVMNPQTGEVLSMVSLPTYDNNAFVHGISSEDLDQLQQNPHRPLMNHAISDLLPPGSVFKPVVAAGALEEGVLEGDTTLNCPGTIILPNKYYPNDPGRDQTFYCWIWRQGSHGDLDVIGGLAQSCDTFFYKTGGGYEDFEGLGPGRIAEYAEMFGLGSPTGIGLAAEASRPVPNPTWKRLTYGESWSTGDTYNMAIGQGYLTVTPLQMLNAINVVANGGTLYRPHIAHHVTDAEGSVAQPFAPQVSRTVAISAEHMSLVQQGMESAVAYGTATRAQVEDVRVAGKTGTAQFCDDIMCGTGGYDQPEHAWFVAYAPVETPEVSVLVFLYNGGEGSTAAAPVAQEILDYYFHGDEADS